MNDKPAVGVYILHNRNTEEVYVGSGDLKERERKHFRSLENGRLGKVNLQGKPLRNHNRRLQAAYNYDPNFEFLSVELPNRDDAFTCEQAVIDKYKDNPKFLNLSIDARAGIHGMSEETRQKISDSRKAYYRENPQAVEEMRERATGKTASQETRERMSASQRRSYEDNPERRTQISEQLSQRVVSVETRTKISQIQSGKTVSKETREKLRQANLSHTVSQETRDKMSAARTGVPKSEEHREKIGEKTKQQWDDPSYREKMLSANSTKVVVNGVVCSSIKNAAQVAGIPYHSMRAKLARGGDDHISYYQS